MLGSFTLVVRSTKFPLGTLCQALFRSNTDFLSSFFFANCSEIAKELTIFVGSTLIEFLVVFLSFTLAGVELLPLVLLANLMFFAIKVSRASPQSLAKALRVANLI